MAKVQQRAKLPGFRPGKAPASIIRQHFAGDIRKQVLESLIPKYLHNRFEAEDLKVVGQPDITEVHFEAGEPLRFKAEFEVVPQVELQDYKGLDGASITIRKSPTKTWTSASRSCGSRRPSS